MKNNVSRRLSLLKFANVRIPGGEHEDDHADDDSVHDKDECVDDVGVVQPGGGGGGGGLRALLRLAHIGSSLRL